MTNDGPPPPDQEVVAAPAHAARRRFAFPTWVGVLLSNRLAVAGIIILLLLILMAVFAPLLTPYAPGDMIGNPSEAPSADHWFGTTHQGQDVFAQVAYGARLSLLIGAIAGLVTTLLAIVVGMPAGYGGGWVDDVLGVVMNMFLVVPQLPLVIVLGAYIPIKGAASMILVIALTSWAFGARVLRSQTLSLANRDFVLAAVIAGDSRWRIIMSEITPNMISLIASTFIFAFTGAILTEAGLEFLGFGDINSTSWGTTLYWAEVNSALLTGAWWHFVFPGLALALAATACVFINYGVDAISNPRLRVIKMRRAPRTRLARRPGP